MIEIWKIYKPTNHVEEEGCQRSPKASFNKQHDTHTVRVGYSGIYIIYYDDFKINDENLVKRLVVKHQTNHDEEE